MKVNVYQHSQHLYDLDLPSIDLENGGEFFIGRADDCHIQLEDQQISRQHALLYYQNGKLKIKKLSEFGSVQVAGNEISEADLSEGAQVAIADFKLQVNQLPVGDDLLPISAPQDIKEEKTEIMPTPEEVAPVLENNESESKTELMQNEFEEELTPESESTDIMDSSEDTENVAEVDEEEDLGPLADNDSFDDESSKDAFNEPSNENNEAFGEGEAEVEFSEDGDEAGFADDSGFGDDGGFGDEGGDVGEATQVFQSFAKYALSIDGQYAPFDKYVIEDKEILIGRDEEKCHIVLNDSEVSGVHAIIKKTLINCFIEDQDSSNGTIYNGERINKAELSNGDNFQIGSTYFSVRIDSDLIQQESDMLMPVEDDQEIEVEEVIEEEVDYGEMGDGDDEYSEDFGGEEPQEKGLKAILKDPKKKRLLMIGAVVLLVLLMLPSEEKDKKSTTKKKNPQSKKAVAKKKKGPQLSAEDMEKLEANYQLAMSKYRGGEYAEAKPYLRTIISIDPNYKDVQTIKKLVDDGFKQLAELKRKEEEEKKRKIRQKKIAELVKKAEEAVEKREVQLAETLFSEILQMDPENYDVPQMKIEIEAYKNAKEKKKLEAERKRALRQSMVDALAPGKALYLKEDWYKAIDKLQKFVKKEGMDEDLIKEATDMIKDSKRKLASIINPLLAKARSSREGQDLKRSYETYGEVLRYDPTNKEALIAREEIFDSLTNRSRKIYRDALISESLSLFDEAKEKFQEVQQISPVNSEYYNKASNKLKNYLE